MKNRIHLKKRKRTFIKIKKRKKIVKWREKGLNAECETILEGKN